MNSRASVRRGPGARQPALKALLCEGIRLRIQLSWHMAYPPGRQTTRCTKLEALQQSHGFNTVVQHFLVLYFFQLPATLAPFNNQQGIANDLYPGSIQSTAPRRNLKNSNFPRLLEYNISFDINIIWTGALRPNAAKAQFVKSASCAGTGLPQDISSIQLSP